MKFIPLVALSLAFVTAVPAYAQNGGKKKNVPDRALLEKMDAVACGTKAKGVTGLGSIWASVGITDMHSNEKLCPRYLLRTDDMEYEIQPTDTKHPAVLPVGKEVVFKIKNDHMEVKCLEVDKKTRNYEVVAMKPTDTGTPSAKNDER